MSPTSSDASELGQGNTLSNGAMLRKRDKSIKLGHYHPHAPHTLTSTKSFQFPTRFFSIFDAEVRSLVQSSFDRLAECSSIDHSLPDEGSLPWPLTGVPRLGGRPPSRNPAPFTPTINHRKLHYIGVSAFGQYIGS